MQTPLVNSKPCILDFADRKVKSLVSPNAQSDDALHLYYPAHLACEGQQQILSDF